MGMVTAALYPKATSIPPYSQGLQFLPCLLTSNVCQTLHNLQHSPASVSTPVEVMHGMTTQFDVANCVRRHISLVRAAFQYARVRYDTTLICAAWS